MSDTKPDQLTKNQHLVPQFYLRHFCNDAEQLFAFDKPTKRCFPSGTSGVGASRFFYDIPPSFLKPGVNPQIVEKTLSVAEDFYSTSLTTVLAHLGRAQQ